MSEQVVVVIVTSLTSVIVTLITVLGGKGAVQAAKRAQNRTNHAEVVEAVGGATQLNSTIAGLVETVNHLAGRVKTLEDEYASARRVRDAALGYIQRLLDYIGAHGQRDAPPVPEPPQAIHDHIES